MPTWNLTTPSMKLAGQSGLNYDPKGWELLDKDPYSNNLASTGWKNTYRIPIKNLPPDFIGKIYNPSQAGGDTAIGHDNWDEVGAGGDAPVQLWQLIQDKTGFNFRKPGGGAGTPTDNDGYLYVTEPSQADPGQANRWDNPMNWLDLIPAMIATYGMAGEIGAAGAGGGAAAGGSTAGEVGAGGAAASGAGGTTAGTSLGLGLEPGVSAAAGGVPASAGTVTSSLGAGGTAGGSALSSGGGALGYGDILKGAIAAAPAVVGAFANKGGTPVTATSTTTNLPVYMQPGAQQTWDEFINNFYGLEGGKSFKSMLDQDTAFKQSRGNQFSNLLQTLTDQGMNRTGMFTPTNISFGGNKVFDFVPKSNRNLANQLATLQGTNYALSDDLAPNKASTDYLDKLFTVITALNPQGNTQNVQQTTTPKTSTWANILQGLTQGTNIYNAMNSGSSNNVKMVQNNDGTYSVVKA